jgi:hypothetical protein
MNNSMFIGIFAHKVRTKFCIAFEPKAQVG